MIDPTSNSSSAPSQFQHVAVAPNDEVYASGQTSNEVVSRFAIVRSRDGGRTWERLPAVGFAGGRLLFPPAYPADDRIFVTSPRGLSVSKDGGRTFLPLSATPGYAAMSPAFSAGNEVFLSGNAPGWFFDSSRAVATPTDLAVPPSAWEANFAFSPRYADNGIVYVGANSFVAHFASMGQRPVVYVCRRSACTEAVRGGSRDSNKPEFAVSRTDGTVWAFATQSLWRSRDGSTFERVALPAPAVPSGVVVSGGATYLSMQPYFGRGGLYRSLDGGDTWEQVAADTFVYGPSWVAALSDGMLVAAPSAVDGLLRSTDRGVTWQKVL